MIHNDGRERGRLKGYMFELVLKRFILQNGFIDASNNYHTIRDNREKFREVLGRGTYHEIDLLLDYDTYIPFFFPIRMFGEVKCYTSPIQKEKIREFIGVLKDIQENYFIHNRSQLLNRTTEIGVFFSASGFSIEAEHLAFAHNIKTISYDNNPLISPLIDSIMILERNHLNTSCIRSGNFITFIRSFSDYLNSEIEEDEFMRINQEHLDGNFISLKTLLVNLKFNANKKIKSSFIGTNSSGVFFHFFSTSHFPDHIFRNTDSQLCRVFFERDSNYFYLIFNELPYEKFFFTPPSILHDILVKNRAEVLDTKETVFSEIQVLKKIDNISRNIVLKIDPEWINNLRNIPER